MHIPDKLANQSIKWRRYLCTLSDNIMAFALMSYFLSNWLIVVAGYIDLIPFLFHSFEVIKKVWIK